MTPPTCAWCGIAWGDLAALDEAEAEAFALARAGGPWCEHHSERHAFARRHQLTGALALLAMTLPADDAQTR